MTDQWRVLDLSGADCEVRSRRGAVEVIVSGRDPTLIAIEDLACVLLGAKARVSSSALHRLCQSGATVLLCDWRGVPEGAIYSWRPHSRVAARRRAQAALSLPRQKNAWKVLVAAKIRNQARALDLTVGGAEFLRTLSRRVRSGDPSNLEGQAASYYWKRLFGSSFRRIPGSGNGINGMLDYAYTIGRGHAIRSILAAGLEPSLGVYHRNRENMFCLADDVVEIVRPTIDVGVWRLFQEGVREVTDCRADLVSIAAARYAKDGATIPTVLTEVSQQFGKYVESVSDRLVVTAWEAPGWCRDG